MGPPQRRTMRHVVVRRQIYTVFYLGKRAGECLLTLLYTPVHSYGAPHALRKRRKRPSAQRSAGCSYPCSARENPRERGLFSIPAPATLPLVHRRTNPGWPGKFAQRVGPRPRAVREGNGL